LFILKKIAQKYDIDIEAEFENPSRKIDWNKSIHITNTHHWQVKIMKEAEEQSSLKYLNLSLFSMTAVKTNPIWESAGTDPKKIHAASDRARMVTGSYILNTTLSKANSQHVDASCHSCQQNEDIVHLLIVCPAYNPIRNSYINRIEKCLLDPNLPAPKSHDEWCRTILNGVPCDPIRLGAKVLSTGT
jgi:hypothetical protein